MFKEEYATLFVDTKNVITNTWEIMIKNKESSRIQY